MEGIEEEGGLDNETMAKKMAKKGKRVLKKDGTSLAQMEEELGLEFIEPVVPRLLEEVKSNILETALLRWKLEDSQKGWRQKESKRTTRRKGEAGNEEIKDS